MTDPDKRETLKLLSLGTVALSGIGSGVVTGNDTDSNSDAEQHPTAELYSTGLLTGNKQVPSVDSNGRGVAVFRRTTDAELEYGLLAFGLDAPVTKAHIHTEESGESGPHIVNLVHGDATEEQHLFGSSVIATGTISDDLVGPYEGSSLDDLTTEMNAGATYVNVHSKAYPDGEIRDQIYPVEAVDIGFETSIGASSDEGASTTPSLEVDISETECR